MKLLQKYFADFFRFLSELPEGISQFFQRIRPNYRDSIRWFGQVARGEEDTRKRLAEYFRWHRKEIFFCLLLAFLISGVDKVQQFFTSFSLDIIEGSPSVWYFAFGFVGNAFVIFWLCYVFWHKPKRTTLLVGLFGKKKAESYRTYYQAQGNVWRVSTMASMPLLLAGAGLSLSLLREHSYTTQSKFVGWVACRLLSYPLLSMLAISAIFFLLTLVLQPRIPKNATLGRHQTHLWRNILLMTLTIGGLFYLFWNYQYHKMGLFYKASSLTLLIFLPPLVLTFMLNSFSECLVKSAKILAPEKPAETEKGDKLEKPKGQVAAAKRFGKAYDWLMWTSYLSCGVALMLMNMKDVTVTEAFSNVASPIAMVIFIAIAYYQAIDWLSYNMTPFRFYTLIGAILILIWFGPQNHYEIKYKAPCEAGAAKRATLESYFLHWLKDRHDRNVLGNLGSQTVYLVATEGGGSRAGAWTTAVLTELDREMGGKFKKQCFAISGVSGGSIGAASTLAWWDNAQKINPAPVNLYADDSARTRYISRVFERNYISSALAGIFFYDGFQQNWFFSWLYPSKYSRSDRHQDEESDAVNLALRVVLGNQTDTLHPRYLKETDFLSLYYHKETSTPRIGLPLFFPNTCRVEEGRRAVSSPILLNTDSRPQNPKWPGNAGLLDIIGAKDRAEEENKPKRLSLGEAASLSELFPFVNSTVHMGEKVGTFMDGGVYENMGLTTLYEIRKALGEIQKSPDTAELQKICPDAAQRGALHTLLANIRFKLILIYNTEHLDHTENPRRDRTLQIFDPITALLQTPFGGHTDYIYHKTKMDFGKADIVEFPLMLKSDFAQSGKYARKASDPIVMSRWLSRHEMKKIMERSKLRVEENLYKIVQ
jgi:hypothetical protein